MEINTGDNDSDDDGLLNAVDPFLRDATNGTSVTVSPGLPTVWEFSQDANDVTPGPDGFGGGLTGVMIDGTTDFEAFFQEPTTRQNQDIQLDNVKFVTAAGGGTTVIEEVQNGDPFQTPNDGQFLFHTGFQLAPNVGTFTVQWAVANPGAVTGGSDITNNFQQIGGYLGDGTQSNYLKIVAIATNNDATQANIQVQLENGDTLLGSPINLTANGIFDNATLDPNSQILFELEIDPIAGTAAPKATYFTTDGTTVDAVELTTTEALDLNGSKVLETIRGEAVAQGQPIGLAAGLFASNFGSDNDTFQAVFDSITVTAAEGAFPPDAVDDSVFTPVNATKQIPVADLLENDTDPNPADTLIVTGVSNAQNGQVSLDNGVVTFVPDQDFEGAASFDYTVSDGNPDTADDTATVTVNVADRVVLFRVNAGGPEIAATDGGIAWSEDSATNNNPNLIEPGSNGTAAFNVSPGVTVPPEVPAGIFQTERWDQSGGAEMQYGFVVAPGNYEVRLFVGNGCDCTDLVGERVYDVAIEGAVPANLDDLDLTGEFGDQVGAMIVNTVQVTDGTLNIEFLHGVENPLVNGIEIIDIGGAVTAPNPKVNVLTTDQTVAENGGQVLVSLATDVTVPLDETVSVTFSIAPSGGATPSIDYSYDGSGATFAGGVYTDTLEIAGGSSDLQIPITILPDTEIDPDEGFTLTIDSVSDNAEIGTANTSVVSIADDDVAPGTALFRVNAGGPEIVDAALAWEADTNTDPSEHRVLNGGGTNQFSANVTVGYDPADVDGAPEALFQTERWDAPAPGNAETLQYAFPVADGDYVVNLYFAEISSSQSANGERQFDVAVEGVVPTVFDDITPFDDFGNNAFVLSHLQSVTDGTLDIEFLHDAVNNPKISAIEIVAAEETGYTPPDDELFGTAVEIADTGDAPSGPVALAPGSNVMSATQEGETGPNGVRDRDYFTVSVPSDHVLTGIILDDFANANPLDAQAFMGLQLGDQVTVDPTANSVEGLLGGVIYNSGLLGQNLLAAMAAGGEIQPGAPDTSVDPFLPALTGDVTVWLNQGAGPSTASLDFVVEPIAPADGAVVAAINAGGPALTQGGVDFEADAFFIGGTQFTDGNGGDAIEPGFAGTVYETERWGDVPFAYSIPVDPGEYVVELHFAEIFQTAPGGRIFDLFIEDQILLNDFDILAETGGVTSAPIVITAPVTFSPDDDDPASTTLDIAFDASVDNAKISGIVLRQAGPTGPAPTPSALVQVNAGGGLGSSTFGNNSFKVTNTGDVDITIVRIDLSTAYLPDMVFDPLGTAGDSGSASLTTGSDGNTAQEVGLTVPGDGGTDPSDLEVFDAPHNGSDSEDGFDVLTLDFTDFNPSEAYAFGVDIDPTSIKGDQNTGDAGSVSGFEMIGSSVTVTFADGSQITTSLFDEGSLGGSDAVVAPGAPAPAPAIAFDGLAAPTIVADPNQSIVVTGAPGASFTLLQVDARLYIDSGSPSGGYDIDDFEANEAVAKVLYTGTLDGAGAATVPVTLLRTASTDAGPEAGLNHFIAVTEEPDGQTSQTSQTLVVEYDPDFVPPNDPPTIDPVADVTVDEETTAEVVIASSDSEDPVALSIAVVDDASGQPVDPADYSLADNGDGTWTFSWLTPDVPADATYTATVTADDGVNPPVEETFALTVADTIELVPGATLYRVNAGGGEIAALDGGPAWSSDTATANNPALLVPGSNNTAGFSVNPGVTVPITVPADIFLTERWDDPNDPEMQYGFTVENGDYEVRLFMGNGFSGTSAPGQRVFDVAIEGSVPANLDDLDLSGQFGHQVGAMIVNAVEVTDGVLNIEFLHDVQENPLVNGIEIVELVAPDATPPTAVIGPLSDTGEVGVLISTQN